MDEEMLLDALRTAIRAVIGDEERATIAYSGGIDSSIVAALAKEVCGVRCMTCAAEGSFDALNAEGRATEEGLSFAMIEITADELADGVAMASRALGTADPVAISYTIPTLRVIESSDDRLVLAGNGADELFGGYSRYTRVQDPLGAMKEDIGKMMYEAAKLSQWATSRGKRAGFPFARDEVRVFSETVPLDRKIRGADRKMILMDVARLLGLPSFSRPKKAAQYSSGVLKLMRQSARGEGKTLADWTRSILEG